MFDRGFAPIWLNLLDIVFGGSPFEASSSPTESPPGRQSKARNSNTDRAGAASTRHRVHQKATIREESQSRVQSLKEGTF